MEGLWPMASGGLYVDRGYRTGLGTAFYDRAAELERLDSAVRGYRLTIVYGPRGVGKSELAHYWASKSGRSVVRVDARRLRLEGLGAGVSLTGLPDAAARLVLDMLRSLGGLSAIARLAVEAARLVDAAARGLVVVIDEFHLLPGYPGGGGREALLDLEALAGALSKRPGAGVSVVATVSEGFLVTGEAVARLEGYSVRWLVVEHMDSRHFHALHEEYASLAGCRLGARVVLALAGGAPGALPSLCPLTVDEVVGEAVPRWLGVLESALAAARARLERQGWRGEPRDVVGLAARLLGGPVKPLEDPLLHALGEELTARNIVYPVWGAGGVRYKPQFPVYAAAIRLAARAGLGGVLGLDPRLVYREALASTA